MGCEVSDTTGKYLYDNLIIFLIIYQFLKYKLMLVKKELLEIDRCNFQRIYKWIQQLIVKYSVCYNSNNR